MFCINWLPLRDSSADTLNVTTSSDRIQDDDDSSFFFALPTLSLAAVVCAPFNFYRWQSKQNPVTQVKLGRNKSI